MKRLRDGYWVTYSDKGKYAIEAVEGGFNVLLSKTKAVLHECETYRQAIQEIEKHQISDVEVARLTSDRIQTGRVKHGIDRDLEWGADILLAHDRAGKRRTKKETSYLSPTQLVRRQRKEVFPTAGVPEQHVYSGLYKRVYVPPRSGSPRDLTSGRASSGEEKK